MGRHMGGARARGDSLWAAEGLGDPIPKSSSSKKESFVSSCRAQACTSIAMSTSTQKPLPIPGNPAPPMEKNQSHSPVELPTPPDDVGLGAKMPGLRDGSLFASRKSPLLYTPAYRAEFPRYTPLSYSNTRSYGIGSVSSSFQLSAERQHVPDPSSSYDADMSVDDVFAVSGNSDYRQRRAAQTYALGVEDAFISPGLVPLLENDDAVPSLDHSLARSMPDSYGRSPSAKRSSLRGIESGSLVHTPSTSSRRVPYNVPSRSPGSMGTLGQSYAISMTPSSSARSARMHPWSMYTRPLMKAQPSSSLPAVSSHAAAYAMYDDDETDDEITGRGVHDDDTDDEAEMTSTKLSHIGHGHQTPMTRSLPTNQHAFPFPSAPRSPDDTSPAQVQLAAAALDRLSMAPASQEDEKRCMRFPFHDESDGVAAIRDRLGGAAHCSAFISKLWHLMINPDLYGKYIRWNEAGDAIIINSEPEVAAEFAAEVLPRLFKHGNNASFIRQLNLYGFQRVSSSRLLDAAEMRAVAARTNGSNWFGAPPPFNTAMELYGAHSSFAHPRFRRGHESWLVSMKPRSSKKSKKTSSEDTKTS